MVVLSIVSVFLLIVEIVNQNLSVSQIQVIRSADLMIALVFLGDFFSRLGLSQNRKQFLAMNWWELLASIPLNFQATRFFRSFQLIRLIRIVYLIRFLRLALRLQVVNRLSKKFANETYILYILSSVIILVFSGALAFHYFEADINPRVDSFGDSFWWALVTASSVGYGDIYPITLAGRIVGGVLIVTGFAAVSIFTAALAAYFLKDIYKYQYKRK
jgi:voltage-gated potassium channel